ncbi:hypothetical protein [Streptomyces sp. NBC_00989]|uniref:hypothetical protein n=1 Tax=Streptomyces sp. NBC_00989 TaxID=2903705 RepID=UPI00386DD4BB|nr:hypothetical protein OG714_38180 [Streptomyces sp. NBC_00989]
MICLVSTRKLKSLEGSVTDLHDRASTHKIRADIAEDRVARALAVLDERGVPADDPLRLILTGDDVRHLPTLAEPKR